MNGVPIETSTELAPRIARIKPGSDASLSVWRNGKEVSAKVRVASLDDEARSASASGDAGGGDRDARLGLWVRELTRQEQRRVGTEGRVVVEKVEGPAADAGLRPGDIILAAGSKPVRTVTDVRAATSVSADSVAFLIQRDDQQIYVPVSAGSRQSRK